SPSSPVLYPLSLHDALPIYLHHPVQWFAYPAGRFDSRTEALVRQAGYVLAVTTQPGSTQDAQAPFALRRYEVLDTTGVSGLASIDRKSTRLNSSHVAISYAV